MIGITNTLSKSTSGGVTTLYLRSYRSNVPVDFSVTDSSGNVIVSDTMLGSFNIDVPVGETLTITAGNSARTVNVTETGARTVYLAGPQIAGIFIQGVSGDLYLPGEWNNIETPNGVAVITNECSFVISLSKITGNYKWSSSTELIPNASVTSNLESAKTMYNGKADTDTIYNYLGSDAGGSISLARNTTFPNGQTGYLGSVGEWNVVALNHDSINRAISVCGGDTLYDHWTSTLYSKGAAWRYYDGTFSPVATTAGLNVRAFTTLEHL